MNEKDLPFDRSGGQVMRNHIAIEKIPYSKKVKEWLVDRYGSEQAESIWQQVVKNYNRYLPELRSIVLGTLAMFMQFFGYLVRSFFDLRNTFKG